MTNLRIIICLLVISHLNTSCNIAGGNDKRGTGNQLSGIIYYAHAGDVYSFDAGTQEINFILDRHGRQGPFFSTDGVYFTSNNWPGARTMVALWELPSASLVSEFSFGEQVFRNEIGVRPSPGAEYFTAVAAGGTFGNFRVVDRQGQVMFEIDQNVFRIKGHGWSPDGKLVLSGEINTQAGQARMMAYIDDLSNPELSVVRGFDTSFGNLPAILSVSNDGRKIVYSLGGSIWMGSLEQEADDHREVVNASQSLDRPVFSPDDTHLALVLLNSTSSMRGDIHVVPIPEGSPVRIEDGGDTRLPGNNNGGIWSSGEDSSLGWFDH